MPRQSERSKAIAHQQTLVDSLKKEYLLNTLTNDDSDTSSLDELNLHIQQRILSQMQSTRYLFRNRKYRKRTIFDFDDALSFDSNEYNDEEFLYLFRLR